MSNSREELNSQADVEAFPVEPSYRVTLTYYKHINVNESILQGGRNNVWLLGASVAIRL